MTKYRLMTNYFSFILDWVTSLKRDILPGKTNNCGIINKMCCNKNVDITKLAATGIIIFDERTGSNKHGCDCSQAESHPLQTSLNSYTIYMHYSIINGMIYSFLFHFPKSMLKYLCPPSFLPNYWMDEPLRVTAGAGTRDCKRKLKLKGNRFELRGEERPAPAWAAWDTKNGCLFWWTEWGWAGPHWGRLVYIFTAWYRLPSDRYRTLDAFTD